MERGAHAQCSSAGEPPEDGPFRPGGRWLDGPQLMEQNDPQAPNEQRQALIAEMVRMEMDAEVGAARPHRVVRWLFEVEPPWVLEPVRMLA